MSPVLLQLKATKIIRRLAEVRRGILVKRYRRQSVRNRHFRENSVGEDRIAAALEPFFAAQIQDVASRLRQIGGKTTRGNLGETRDRVEKHLQGQHDQQTHGRGTGAKFTGDVEITFSGDGDFEAISKDLLGTSDEAGVVKACGIPDGSDVKVVSRSGKLYVSYKNKSLGIEYAARTIKRDRDDNVVIQNRHFHIGEKGQGKGTGTAVLNEQVKNAASMGVSKLVTSAERSSSPGGQLNGAYTWARLGYNGPLSKTVQNKLSSEEGIPYWLKNAKTIHDIIARPGGREWWIKNNESFEGEFDLTEKSQSRRILDHYVAEKARNRAGGKSTKHLQGQHDQQTHGRGKGKYNILTSKGREEATKDRLESLIGSRDLNEVARLAAMPEGSTVSVAAFSYQGQPAITCLLEDTDDERFQFMQRTISKDRDGNLFMVNQELVLRETGTGLGTKLFTEQVKNATKAGVKYIKTLAKSVSGALNGAYTWARLGYNGKLSNRAKQKLADDDSIPYWLKNAKTIHDIIARPGGREWWINNHETFDATFDLTEKSQSRRILDHYVAEKARNRAGGKSDSNSQSRKVLDSYAKEREARRTGGKSAGTDRRRREDFGRDLGRNRQGTNGKDIAATAFDTQGWFKKLIDQIYPVLAKLMIEAMAADLRSMGLQLKSTKHLGGQHDQQTHGRGKIKFELEGISDQVKDRIVGVLGGLQEKYKPVEIQSVSASSELEEGQAAEAYTFTLSGGSADEQRLHYLSLNRDVWKDAASIKEHTDAASWGWVVDATSRGMLIHEFAHVLEKEHVDPKRLAKLYKDRKKDLPMISRYAATNPREMFAEAFILYERMGEAGLKDRGGVDFSEFIPLFKELESTKQAFLRTKASTASEYLAGSPDLLSEEIFHTLTGPVAMGFLAEYPLWMQQAIEELLDETFQQDFWARVNETTLGDIEQFIRQGLRDGWSIDRIAREMAPNLIEQGQYAIRRGKLIARTETTTALNSARSVGIDSVKEEVRGQIPIKKVWLSVLGTTTRDTHANLDGVPEDSEGMWELAGLKIRWPGDSILPPEERCNCQCTIVSEFGMTDIEAQQLISRYQDRIRKMVWRGLRK